MAYITKEYLENNIKNYDQYRNLDKEGQANGLATLDANGKLVSSQIPSGVGAATYNGNPVTSIVAGSNTAMSLTNGALTIASTASVNGLEIVAGVGLTKSDTATTRTLKLKTATYDKKVNKTIVAGLGGIKVAMGGTKAFDYNWNSTNDAAPSIVSSESDVPVTVYQPNRNNGKYYPVECTTDSAAVVCIPNVPSPFYEEDISDPFIFTIEDYTVEGVAKKGLSITCPSNVIFAQLDLPVTLPSITIPLLATVQSTKVNNKQTLSIQSSAPEAGFTPGSTTYAYLRFTTKPKKDNGVTIENPHTYNATIAIAYRNGNYTVTSAF